MSDEQKKGETGEVGEAGEIGDLGTNHPDGAKKTAPAAQKNPLVTHKTGK